MFDWQEMTNTKHTKLNVEENDSNLEVSSFQGRQGETRSTRVSSPLLVLRKG